MPTATYNFATPTVGGSSSTWGASLNANWELMDDLLDGTAPISGDPVFTGAPNLSGITNAPAVRTALGLGSLATQSLDNVNIDGGTIDGVAGSFTTLSAAAGGTLAGAFTASGVWDFTSTEAVRLPRGTNAQRPATPLPGDTRVNSDEGDLLEVYADSTWQQLLFEFRAQPLKNKTIQGPTKTETNSVSWGGAVTLDPEDGLILMVTLTDVVQPITDNLADEESVLLLIDDGAGSDNYTITWPTMTWLSDDGVAPTLRATGLTSVLLWKDGTTLYGFCGNGA